MPGWNCGRDAQLKEVRGEDAGGKKPAGFLTQSLPSGVERFRSRHDAEAEDRHGIDGNAKPSVF
jgi:hypothetical protein